MARRGTPGRINDQKLCQLLVEGGRTQKQAAVHSGASEAAVSKRLKKLRWKLTRRVGLERVREVADRGLDVFAQLQAINRTIREELAWAVDAARQPAGERKGLQQVIADLAGEIRKQLPFQFDVFRSLHDMRAVADFQQEVLDVVQETTPEGRDRIIHGLAERRTLRRTISVPTLGGEALATREEFRRRLHGWMAAHPGQPAPEADEGDGDARIPPPVACGRALDFVQVCGAAFAARLRRILDECPEGTAADADEWKWLLEARAPWRTALIARYNLGGLGLPSEHTADTGGDR